MGRQSTRGVLAFLGCACLLSAAPSEGEVGGAAVAIRTTRDGALGVRIGGYFDDSVLLVMPDLTAAAVPVGGSYGGLKLLSLGDTRAAIEYNGEKANIYFDPSWQLAPYPDLNTWKEQYLKFAGRRIDAHTVATTQRETFSIMANGATTSKLMKVQQSVPFDRLPEFLESITVAAQLNPHEPTILTMTQMRVTQAAYDRLSKSLYSTTPPPPAK